MWPVIAARSPSDSIITLTWPGVWPVEGVSRISRDHVFQLHQLHATTDPI